MTDLPPLDADIAYVVVAENDQRGPPSDPPSEAAGEKQRAAGER